MKCIAKQIIPYFPCWETQIYLFLSTKAYILQESIWLLSH